MSYHLWFRSVRNVMDCRVRICRDMLEFEPEPENERYKVTKAPSWVSVVTDIYTICCGRCRKILNSTDLYDLEEQWENAGWDFIEDLDGMPPHMLCMECLDYVDSVLESKGESRKKE